MTDLAVTPVAAKGRSVTGRAVGAQSPAAPSGDPAFGLEPANPARAPGYRLLFATAALALVAFGAVRPGVAAAALVVLLIVSRLAEISVDEFRARRLRHGPRRTDALVAALLSPWHLVRAVFGVLPAAAVGLCAGVIVVLLGLIVFAPGNVIIAPIGTVEARSVGGMNEPIVDSLVLSVAMLVTVLVSWFGPASYATRIGSRLLLRRIAPTRWPKIVLALVVLALAVLAAEPLFDGSVDVLWWPLTDRPDVVW